MSRVPELIVYEVWSHDLMCPESTDLQHRVFLYEDHAEQYRRELQQEPNMCEYEIYIIKQPVY